VRELRSLACVVRNEHGPRQPCPRARGGRLQRHTQRIAQGGQALTHAEAARRGLHCTDLCPLPCSALLHASGAERLSIAALMGGGASGVALQHLGGAAVGVGQGLSVSALSTPPPACPPCPPASRRCRGRVCGHAVIITPVLTRHCSRALPSRPLLPAPPWGSAPAGGGGSGWTERTSSLVRSTERRAARNAERVMWAEARMAPLSRKPAVPYENLMPAKRKKEKRKNKRQGESEQKR